MSEWFYSVMGEEVGPLSPEQMREHAAAGRITFDTLIRKGNESDWVLAERVNGLFDAVADSQPSSEVNEGNVNECDSSNGQDQPSKLTEGTKERESSVATDKSSSLEFEVMMLRIICGALLIVALLYVIGGSSNEVPSSYLTSDNLESTGDYQTASTSTTEVVASWSAFLEKAKNRKSAASASYRNRESSAQPLGIVWRGQDLRESDSLLAKYLGSVELSVQYLSGNLNAADQNTYYYHLEFSYDGGRWEFLRGTEQRKHVYYGGINETDKYGDSSPQPLNSLSPELEILFSN